MLENSTEIDYDNETIFFDNGWRTREDLARQIKAMIDRGDYRVALPSSRLERLEAALAGARILAARTPPELAEAIEARAAREGRSVGALMREALGRYLEGSSSGQPLRQGSGSALPLAQVAAPKGGVAESARQYAAAMPSPAAAGIPQATRTPGPVAARGGSAPLTSGGAGSQSPRPLAGAPTGRSAPSASGAAGLIASGATSRTPGPGGGGASSLDDPSGAPLAKVAERLAEAVFEGRDEPGRDAENWFGS